MAVDGHRFAEVELRGRVGVELLERDADGAGQALLGVFVWRQDLDQLGAVVEQLPELSDVDAPWHQPFTVLGAQEL